MRIVVFVLEGIEKKQQVQLHIYYRLCKKAESQKSVTRSVSESKITAGSSPDHPDTSILTLKSFIIDVPLDTGLTLHARASFAVKTLYSLYADFF